MGAVLDSFRGFMSSQGRIKRSLVWHGVVGMETRCIVDIVLVFEPQ